MDYIEKLQRMDEHLKRHPSDYQTVISRLKLASDIYDHQKEKQKNERLRRLAEIKRKLKEEDDGRRLQNDKTENLRWKDGGQISESV